MIMLVSPGVTSNQKAGGGAAFFRGVAEAAGALEGVLAVSPSAQGGRLGPHLSERYARSARDVLGIIADERPRVVVKASGALGRDEDRQCDLALLSLRDRRHLQGLIYLDVDAPSRLPILAYQPHTYMGMLGAAGVPALLVGGGSRALHQYRALGFERAITVSTSIAWAGLRAILASDLGLDDTDQVARDVDVCSLVGPQDPRRARESALLTSARASGLSSPSANRSYVPLAKWWRTLRRSKVCLNLLRDDVLGYPDVASARVFEAVSAGCVLMSDDFPGLSSLVPAPYRLSPPTSQAEWEKIAVKVRRDGLLMGRAAHQHLVAVSEVATDLLREALAGWVTAT